MFKHCPVIFRICCEKSAPSDIGIKAWLKIPKWASQAQVLFSASDCLCCWPPNGTLLKDNVYMSSRTVCHKESNWSAMTTGNILCDWSTSGLKWPRFENHTKGQAGPWRHTLLLYRLWKMYYQFRSIITCIDHFGLVFVKSNMISNIKLIVTNIQMWKDLGLSGPGWPFVWG